jgi:D-lactate dehydrogenase
VYRGSSIDEAPQFNFPIYDSNQVVCLAGCGILTLVSSVHSWIPERETQSILGSTFLNPTTAAGVAFGSGGVYVRKGPQSVKKEVGREHCDCGQHPWC